MKSAHCHFLAGLLCILIWISGCGLKNLSGHRFLLPWPDSQGGYSLQIVEISSLNSPYSVSGPVAKVYANASFGNDGFIGEPAVTQLSLADGVFVPNDVLSSLSLSVYAHYEQLAKLDKTLGAKNHLPWPRRVGIDVPVSGKNEGLEFNNAQYYSHYDITVVLPYKMQGLPMAANAGIVAHEHFHAHFNHLVLRPLKIEYWKNLNEDQAFNLHVVLRGWNEGLADYYAFVYTGDPDFLSESFVNGETNSRGLNQRGRLIVSSEAWWRAYHQLLAQGESADGISYSLGSEFARLLYELGQTSTVSHKQIMKSVFQRLQSLPQWLTRAQKIASRRLSTHVLFDFLFAKDEWISDETCSIFRRHFQEQDLKQLEIGQKCL